MLIYLDIPPYTSIYLHIPPYTFIYLQIALYTFIHSTYIKILNIGKMTANIRPKNGHNSGPRVSPMARIWHAPSYHTQRFFHAQRTPILVKLKVLNTFLGVIKVHNPNNSVHIYKCHAAQALTHKIGPNAERCDNDMPKR